MLAQTREEHVEKKLQVGCKQSCSQLCSQHSRRCWLCCSCCLLLQTCPCAYLRTVSCHKAQTILVLQLEDQIKQLQEQKQHIAVQLQQLEGCDCSRDVLGISDLSAQLQVCHPQLVGMLVPRNVQLKTCKLQCSSACLGLHGSRSSPHAGYVVQHKFCIAHCCLCSSQHSSSAAESCVAAACRSRACMQNNRTCMEDMVMLRCLPATLCNVRPAASTAADLLGLGANSVCIYSHAVLSLMMLHAMPALLSAVAPCVLPGL